MYGWKKGEKGEKIRGEEGGSGWIAQLILNFEGVLAIFGRYSVPQFLLNIF